MNKQKLWRVRVMRRAEDWVEIRAESAVQAEQQAATLPFIISVFARSAIPGDKPLAATDPLGALGDSDGD